MQTKEEKFIIQESVVHDICRAGEIFSAVKVLDIYVQEVTSDLSTSNQTLLDEVNRLNGENAKTKSALKGLLKRYTELVECGDCGYWDAEKEFEVIEARKVL